MKRFIQNYKKSGIPGCKFRDKVKLAALGIICLCIIGLLCGMTIAETGDFNPLSIALVLPIAGQILTACDPGVPFTGTEGCSKVENKTIALIITSDKASYTSTPDAFNTALEGLVSDTGINRIYPITDVLNNTPSGGDVATADVGFSGAQPIGINAFSEVYQVDGGICLYKELTALNGRLIRVFRIDDENYIYGTIADLDPSSAPVFRGYLAKVYVTQSKGDGSNPYQLNVTVYYSANYENELKKTNAFVVNNIPEGLVGVNLRKDTTGAKVVGACSGIDYTAQFGTSWDVTCFINTAGASPASVTFNAATGYLTISPSAQYKVAKATVLKGKGITGISGNDVAITV